MSFSRAVLIIGCIVTCVNSVNGHPDGAPEGSCDTLAINHNVSAQSGENPFMIMFDPYEVKTGETVSVEIMSDYMDDYFEGILLKAIDASQDDSDYSGIAGCFVIAEADSDNYHYLNCSDSLQSAVTHSSAINKTKVTVTWQAPNISGSYVFVASIAQDHDVFWLPIRSDPLNVSAGVVEHANKLAVFIFALVAVVKYL